MELRPYQSPSSSAKDNTEKSLLSERSESTLSYNRRR